MIDGKRLRELREANGYSRKRFAELIEVGEAQVARYEFGENDATGDVLARIAKLFNVSTDYLLGLTDNPVPAGDNTLRPAEIEALSAWRRGDFRKAIKVIIEDE
jgi:transcriptional regulator with XRE-family HTH domain